MSQRTTNCRIGPFTKTIARRDLAFVREVEGMLRELVDVFKSDEARREQRKRLSKSKLSPRIPRTHSSRLARASRGRINK